MSTPIVGLSAGYTVKNALFDRLKAERDGGLLVDWSVDYAFNGNAGAKQIYGGGWRTVSREDAVAESNGLLVHEVLSVPIYLRVKVSPPVDVAETDAICDAAAAVIARVMFNDPKLAGDMTWLGIQTAQGDYSQTGTETISIAAYAALIDAYLTWRP